MKIVGAREQRFKMRVKKIYMPTRFFKVSNIYAKYYLQMILGMTHFKPSPLFRY